METFIESIPEEFQEIYRQHWSTIRKSVKRGKFKDVYHFPLSLTDKISGKLDEVLSNYDKHVKLNVAFGYIMRYLPTDNVKFYHPSNNTMVFDTARLVMTPTDIMNIKTDIERDDLLDIARNSRPSTAWQVECLACIRFDVYRMMKID